MSRSLLLRSLVLLLVCLFSSAALAGGKGKVRRSRAPQVKLKAPKRMARVPGGESLRKDVAAAFQLMIATARQEGIFLWAGSGYRTLAEQRRLYRRFRRGLGPKAARPGRSNHHLGIAVDIPVGGDESSVNYDWLATHACRFGFQRTVANEPWHWEYRPQTAPVPAEGVDCRGRSLTPQETTEQTTTEEAAPETLPTSVPIFLDPVLVKTLSATHRV